jgi:hypothetical protein
MLGSLRSQTSMWSTSAWLNNWVLRLAPGGLAPLAANRLADCQRHTDCGGIGLAVHEQPIGGGGHGGQASWCAAAPGGPMVANDGPPCLPGRMNRGKWSRA